MKYTEQASIELINLSTGYKQKGCEHYISQGLNLSLERGQIAMLMGPNGAGKSTLLHTLSGLIPSLAGEILLSGESLRKISASRIAQLLSLVLTNGIATPDLSVEEIVSIGRHPYTGYWGRLSKQDKDIIQKAIATCHLEGYESKTYHELSDGEKQRVMIARALAQDTPLILLDEPTAHLDLPSRLDIILMLRELAHQTNKSILISTHELELALSWSDTLWLMDRGGMVTAGSPEDLVLGGHIEGVFGNERLHYEAERASFSLAQHKLQPIYLEGEGLRRVWTERALHRLGYRPCTIEETEPTSPHLHIIGKQWELRCGEQISVFLSIQNLASTLQTIKQQT